MNGRARADGTDTYGSVILGDSGAKKMDSQNQHEDDRTPITVGFVGNPNCGKTTLFNAFTGAKLKVANWPGVTVERVEGETSYKGRPIKVIDLPAPYAKGGKSGLFGGARWIDHFSGAFTSPFSSIG